MLSNQSILTNPVFVTYFAMKFTDDKQYNVSIFHVTKIYTHYLQYADILRTIQKYIFDPF